ncbi:MAG: Ig domain-containing protein, partial [Candidatus Thermoplasmatota archaeon]|nr:Ig domain-containing protein [Candidatus Thermoplasmatota archaeon]
MSVLLLAIFLSGLPSSLAGNGVSTTSSSGVGSTDSISNGYSSVSNINNAYDSSSSSYTRLLADGDFSGNFGSFCGSQSTMAYAEVLYTLYLSANTNQSMTMSVYSQTEYDFSTGWSTVPSLKMTANVTDNGGTWNAWTSTSTNNSASPSSGDIDLGAVTPRSNNTIDVLVRLEHQGVWTSSCRAELRVYDFSSDAVVAPSIAYSGSPFTFTKDNTIGTITPSNTGGAATSWSITSGSLPSGLSMSSSTGALTGT